MQLTEALKAEIDGMTYQQMLAIWRFSGSDDELLHGESGAYLAGRMKAMRAEPGGQEEHVRASKAIGW